MRATCEKKNNLKKKVLYITVRSDFGGGSRHLCDLIIGSKNKYEVSVAAPSFGKFYSCFQKHSDCFLSIPYRRFSLISFFKLLIHIKAKDINIVHSHGRGAGIYSRLLGLFGVPVVHTFHGIHYGDSFFEKLKLLLEIPLSFLSKRTVCVSDQEFILLKKLNIHHNCEVIYNGVDMKNVEASVFDNERVIGSLTRLDPHKNNSELIKFMAHLEGYKLIIAGDGEEKEFLMDLVKKLKLEERVFFLGYCSNIEYFFDSIGIFASASKGEGLPYSVLEAMARGKKIIASRVDGHVQLLGEGNLYKLGDFSSFAEKLYYLKPTRLDEMYSKELMISSTLTVLDQEIS